MTSEGYYNAHETLSLSPPDVALSAGPPLVRRMTADLMAERAELETKMLGAEPIEGTVVNLDQAQQSPAPATRSDD